jgi:hypothetical protein
VPGRELGRARDHGGRDLVELVGVPHDDVATRRSRDVQPEVVGLRDAEGQLVVLGVAAADEHLEAVHDDGPVDPPAAAHPPSRRACYSRRFFRLKVRAT